MTPVSEVPLVAMLVALLAEGLLAGLPGLRWVLDLPQAMIRNLARWLYSKLNRATRGCGILRLRGAIVAIVVVAIAGSAGSTARGVAGSAAATIGRGLGSPAGDPTALPPTRGSR